MKLLAYPLLLLRRKHSRLVERAVPIKAPLQWMLCKESQSLLVHSRKGSSAHWYFFLFISKVSLVRTLMHLTITRYKSKSCVRTLLYSHFSVTQWGLHSNHVKKIKFKALRVSQESIHSGQNMTIKFLNHKFYTKSHTGNYFSTQNQFWKRPEWISTKIKLQLQGCYRGVVAFPLYPLYPDL